MTRYEPIGAKRKRGASLVERAAEAYDFSAALRGEMAPALPPVDSAVEPVAAPETPVASASQPVETKGFAPTSDWAPMPAPRGQAQPIQPIDREKLSNAGFLIPDGPVTGLSEEFRIVKRQLLGMAVGQDGTAIGHAERILVCSAHANEGKTFCAINLALSIASEKEMEVLLIDADFAKPSIPDLMGLRGGPGFMDALVDPQVAIEDCIIPTDLPHLSVLPAGRRTNNDSEYLASSRTKKVLDALTRPGRVLLFDSPPVLAASPASVLATHVGQTLMIVRADRTTETVLKDAIGLLQGCKTLRLLLNGVKFSTSGRRFGTYYGQEADNEE